MSRPIAFIKRLIHGAPPLQELAPVLRNNDAILLVGRKVSLQRSRGKQGNVRRVPLAGAASVASRARPPCRALSDDTSVARKSVFCAVRHLVKSRTGVGGDAHKDINVEVDSSTVQERFQAYHLG